MRIPQNYFFLKLNLTKPGSNARNCNSKRADNADYDDDDDDDDNNDINDITYKNTLANANTSRTLTSNMSDLSGRLMNSGGGGGNGYHYDATSSGLGDTYSSSNSERISLRKRDSSLDTKQQRGSGSSSKTLDSVLSPTSSYLYGSSFSSNSNPSKWTTGGNNGGGGSSSTNSAGGGGVGGSSTRGSLKSQYLSNYEGGHHNDYEQPTSGGLEPLSTSGSAASSRRPAKYASGSSKYAQPGLGLSASGGSKTERIISKSSKSSPNLAGGTGKEKDYYDHYYTDR